MGKGSFRSVALNEHHKNWEELTKRQTELYARKDEIRSSFARDYTRILHSLAFRRLKHKTQVFFNIENDHICTRMEHVAHVESVSGTIAKYLGLNDELTKAIAIGHDLGHAPFGHEGESVIQTISRKHLHENFWHEQNSLRFVDKIELLEDNYKRYRNLDLTYAVRDGIISHCGEVDENGLFPRNEIIPLEDITAPGQVQPATWEGCVVKIADKIAYLGRDIDDAISLGFLSQADQHYLLDMAQADDQNVLNTTVIMHNLILDICKNSSPERGICLSGKFFEQMNTLKQFNYEHIYRNKRLLPFQRYAGMVITELFDTLLALYDGKHTLDTLETARKYYPQLVQSFERWLARYCTAAIVPAGELQSLALLCENEKLYGSLEKREIFIRAILDFISGMTDRFAIKAYQELLTF